MYLAFINGVLFIVDSILFIVDSILFIVNSILFAVDGNGRCRGSLKRLLWKRIGNITGSPANALVV